MPQHPQQEQHFFSLWIPPPKIYRLIDRLIDRLSFNTTINIYIFKKSKKCCGAVPPKKETLLRGLINQFVLNI